MPRVQVDKSQVIRDAIAENPGLSTAELVELLNDSTDRMDDKLVFTEADVASVRKSLRRRGPAREASERAAPEPVAETPPPQRDAPARKQPKPRQAPTPAAASAASPVELIDKVFDLAKECGGFEQLKRLVDRIAEIRRR